MKDFWQTITTHLTLLPFIDKCYREFECRLIKKNQKIYQALSDEQTQKISWALKKDSPFVFPTLI
jgi:hypothetical protein